MEWQEACENKEKTVHTNEFFVKGLFLAATAACQKQNVLEEMVREVQKEKYRIVPDCEHCASPCGNTSDYDLNQLYQEEEPGPFRQICSFRWYFKSCS